MLLAAQAASPLTAAALAAPALLAACFGLALGSFLNVLRTRWPNAESIALPASHCRTCSHTLAWWENIPLLSFLLLRGRCRQCHTRISWLYPAMEALVGLLFTLLWIQYGQPILTPGYDSPSPDFPGNFTAHSQILWLATTFLGYAIFSWLLVALAALDLEQFWLPDALTLPGIALGILFNLLRNWAATPVNQPIAWLPWLYGQLLAILAPAAIVLVIRLAYWLVRHKEGMGLGDAKLMAMLGAWLGIVPAIESFVLGIFLTAAAALVLIAVGLARGQNRPWAAIPLPLGTFLAIAGILEIWTHASIIRWWLAACLFC